ncbi:MAG: exodeoxyribonuclease VII small subunit [Endomicrobiia bacterium]|jgi:exodeoxyribonuclease VII small subunit|nr:exodeoxyribonuclease VII small subunit [Endomicrobiaceae bacterium]MDD3053552.1 exodeoxyribonuclease VII small subunit [Endomicrobiaceae bacterium]MDD3922343.1 exodeoxyribonuclease VII small subunit [Endomicrobiaceae bacterium]MDD5101617.1 exodeoxyribonuclease VII small subunit [Endomicrobiaceae bacterium]
MKKHTFETSLKRLEIIVDEMENSQLDIDKAMKLFEEGVSLVNECSSKLDETKKKIEILIEKNGKIEKEKFIGIENDNENK